MSLDSSRFLEQRNLSTPWHDVRFIGALTGRYILSDRKNDDGEAAVYACRLSSMSTRMAVIVAPVIGNIGAAVATHFDEFGLVRGEIVRRLPNGFVMKLQLTEAEREKLAAKIVWLKDRVHHAAPDRREYKRILPHAPRTELTLVDGERMPCFVIDISRSGAAISANTRPKLGAPVVLGRLPGQVVRHLDVGFAVQFVDIQETEQLEPLMAPVKRSD
jgi:hypothetical protein